MIGVMSMAHSAVVAVLDTTWAIGTSVTAGLLLLT